jgi:photosystem II stability/assembly factor-like uncharacterized protein
MMRKTVLIALTFLALCGLMWAAGEAPVTNSLPAGVSGDLRDVCFVSETIGWAVGTGGVILRSEDGGRNWKQQESGTSAPLYSVYYADEHAGWIVGGSDSTGAVILHTVDAGNKWSVQESGCKFPLFDVVFSDDHVGLASGTGGAVLNTTDAGAHWTIQSPCSTFNCPAVAVRGLKCWVASRDGIRRSMDGGATWAKVNCCRLPAYDLYFKDELHGWVVGDFGSINATVDGGTRWKPQSSLSGRNLRSVYFSDLQNGWIVGDGGVIRHTTSGGQTWISQSGGTKEDLQGVVMYGRENGWIVGNNGTVLRSTDGGLSWRLPGAPVEAPAVTAKDSTKATTKDSAKKAK